MVVRITPLPAFNELVIERRDLPPYEVEARCANPRCPNQADDKHEIRPRSQTAGLSWWIEIPGKYLVGNRVGLCRACHGRTDDHTAAIIWDDRETELAWADLTENWAEGLDPMPPIHRIDHGAVKETLEQSVGGKPFVDEPYVAPIDEPPESEAVEGYERMEPLGRSMQNMERFLGNVEGSETVPAIEPNRLDQIQEDLRAEDLGSAQGDDDATVARAREATETAQQRAVDVTGMGEFTPSTAPWQADVIVFPDENRVEVLHGDLRVGSFIEEQIEKAKRAPKPRAPKPPEDPDREREPAKARRTWSISVPSNERTDERVAAGEDGYQLIEEALDNLRQQFGDDDHPGWRYFTLIKALAWMLQMYTSEGEE